MAQADRPLTPGPFDHIKVLDLAALILKILAALVVASIPFAIVAFLAFIVYSVATHS